MLGKIVEFASLLIPVVLVSTLVVRLIYYPLVGQWGTLFAPIVSTIALVFFVGWYGLWADAQHSGSTMGHSIIWVFIVLPLTLGWIGNLVWDIVKVWPGKKPNQ